MTRDARMRQTVLHLLCLVICLTSSMVTACGSSVHHQDRASQGTHRASLACLEHQGFRVTRGRAMSPPTGAAPPEIISALRRCGLVIHGTQIGGEVNRAVVRRELFRNVQCIREHGFHVTPGRNIELEPYETHGIDTSRPAFRSAVATCRNRFIQAVRRFSPGSVPIGVGGAKDEGKPTALAKLARCLHRFGAAPAEASHTPGFSVLTNASPQTVSKIIGKCRLG